MKVNKDAAQLLSVVSAGMSGILPHHEAGRSAYFNALFELVMELIEGKRYINVQDFTRLSLWVGPPDRKKFLYVGLHGFYRVTMVDDFKRMARILTNNLPIRGEDNKTAWTRHLQIAFIIAIVCFITGTVIRGCPGMLGTTLACSMA